MIYILTIKGRESLVDATIKSLINQDIEINKIKIVYGFTEKRKNINCMKTFFNKILPQMLEDTDETFYIEDGSIFVKNLYDYTNDTICWSGYIKKLSTYWIGSKCIYFSKEILKDLNTIKDRVRLRHLDGFFTKYILTNNYEKPTINSICYQLDYKRSNGTELQMKQKLRYIELQRNNLKKLEVHSSID